MDSKMKGYTVLVTGAAGFLGQHMVGLLQTRAEHVKEIRVLDIVPYINKTDYAATKPVHQFVGSIQDKDLVEEACKGVSCVIHLASLIDVSLFPDKEKSHQVNVEGTRTIIEACRKTGVERLLYCSSSDVVFGQDSTFDGNEDNTTYAEENFFPVYGKTKQLAEELVLEANSDSLKTLSLRPVTIYGDYDWKNLGPMFGNPFTKKTNYYGKMVVTFKMSDYVYAGNVAWAFIHADNALRARSSDEIAGKAFFIKDDTPRNDRIKFFDPILDECNLKPFPLSPPAWLILLILRFVFPLLELISLVYKKISCPFGKWAFRICDTCRLISDEKAREVLGYKPIFDQTETNRRVSNFIKTL